MNHLDVFVFVGVEDERLFGVLSARGHGLLGELADPWRERAMQREDTDVVARASVGRQVDEQPHRFLGLAGELERLLDLSVVDLVGEPVRAQHVAIAGHDLVRAHRDAHAVVHPQGVCDHVARKPRRVVGRDVRGHLEHVVDQRVVLGKPLETSVAEPIAPAAPTCPSTSIERVRSK